MSYAATRGHCLGLATDSHTYRGYSCFGFLPRGVAVKLRHVAIVVPDLEKAAAFGEGDFGLRDRARLELDGLIEGAKGALAVRRLRGYRVTILRISLRRPARKSRMLPITSGMISSSYSTM